MRYLIQVFHIAPRSICRGRFRHKHKMSVEEQNHCPCRHKHAIDNQNLPLWTTVGRFLWGSQTFVEKRNVIYITTGIEYNQQNLPLQLLFRDAICLDARYSLSGFLAFRFSLY